MAGVDLDLLSFNANFYFKGLETSREFNWVGTNVMLGSAQFEVVKHTQLCSTISINLAPDTRDYNFPQSLAESSRVSNLGIYARVVASPDTLSGNTMTGLV